MVQINTTLPEGLPTVDANSAGFGPRYPQTNDNLVWSDIQSVVEVEPSDGCSTINTNLTGRVALISRGSCYFMDKVYR